jgi:subtilisin family serine protease
VLVLDEPARPFEGFYLRRTGLASALFGVVLLLALLPAGASAAGPRIAIPSAASIAAAGGRLMVVSTAGRRHAFRTVVAPAGRERAVAAAAAAQPGVVAVVPDVPVMASGWPASGAPNDPYYGQYQADLAQIGVTDAWKTTTGSTGITVAILDTGADLSNPDLAGVHVAGTYNTVATLPGNAANPAYHTATVTDGAGHGTHVLGTIAAQTNNGVGVAGIAPGVSVLVVKVLDDDGSGSSTWVNDGIEWAISHGANIISMSLGALQSPSSCAAYYPSTDDAYAAGVAVVAAAGNDGNTSYSLPASCPHVLSVASVNGSNVHSVFSQSNSEVDIAAPGESIVSTYPAALGHTYLQLSGTSMATPHVAGVAALVESARGAMTPDELTSVLEGTATDLGPAGRDDAYGYGLVRADAAVVTPTPSPPPVATPTPAPDPAATPSPGDATPPVMLNVTAPGAVSAASGPFVVSFLARDDTAVTGYRIDVSHDGGSTWQPPILQTDRTATFTDLVTGWWVVDVSARDAAGNWSNRMGVLVHVDVVAPTLTRLSAPSVVTSADRSFAVSLAGSDDAAGVKVQVRRRLGPTGTWSASTFTAAPSIAMRGLAAGTWRIDARAVDVLGNVSAWREVLVVVPKDDRSWSFTAGTTRRTSSAWYAGTLTTTRTAGARLTIRFTGSTFTLIGRVGLVYGRMRVTIDGVILTVDEGRYLGAAATTTRNRVVLLNRTLKAGTHTVVITNLATPGRPTINLDAVGWRS